MSDRIIVSRHPAAVEFVARAISRGVEEVWRINPNWPGEVVRVMHDGNAVIRLDGIPVRSEVGPDDVRDRIVYGNLPLHLACLAAEVHAIEFGGRHRFGTGVFGDGICLDCAAYIDATASDSPCESNAKPPRGAEYTLADMVAAGARLVCYRVEKVERRPTFTESLGM